VQRNADDGQFCDAHVEYAGSGERIHATGAMLWQSFNFAFDAVARRYPQTAQKKGVSSVRVSPVGIAMMAMAKNIKNGITKSSQLSR